MKKFLKLGAASAALALVGSLGLGTALSAEAAVVPAVGVDAPNGVAQGPEVDVTISGCSVADGARTITLWLYSHDTKGYVSELDLAAPETGDLYASVLAPLPGLYDVEVDCFDYEGTRHNLIAPVFEVTRGYLDLAGPGGADTWSSNDPVTLTSPVLADGSLDDVHAFDPGSVVTLYVIGPDGVRHDLGTELANAMGDLSTTRVLPYTVDGTYEVFAEGTKTMMDGTVEVVVPVLLYSWYAPIVPEAPAAPAVPAAPPAGKPTALPKTGSEGLGLLSAASLLSLVGGTIAVSLRSRKR